MTDFNKELADKEFYQGKSYLDSGMFLDAINAYDLLLSKYEKFEGSKQTNILVETSLNNRGAAKCQLGLREGDKKLFQSGMADFEKSIAIDDAQNEEDRKFLTAYKNLEFARSELSTFGMKSANEADLKNFSSI